MISEFIFSLCIQCTTVGQTNMTDVQSKIGTTQMASKKTGSHTVSLPAYVLIGYTGTDTQGSYADHTGVKLGLHVCNIHCNYGKWKSWK